MNCEVKVLREGYVEYLPDGHARADCTVTLIRAEKNILVDTGNPNSGAAMTQALEREGLAPTDIHVVVCSHCHPDHMGCNCLFADARFYVGQDQSDGDMFTFFDYSKGRPNRICEGVEIVHTPGHTRFDVTVLVQTADGLTAVVGDLFFKKEDLADESIWRRFSEAPDAQAASRERILKMADFIVPGHGGMFGAREAQSAARTAQSK